MNYNPLIDIALLGAALTVMALIVRVTSRPKRGATPEPDRRKLQEHQEIRRILMQDGEYNR